jgi:two-component system chemotaxis sensor kinase CheA
VKQDDELDNTRLLDVLCHPGFSTRHGADMESGRGIGMAVVRTAVAELGGSLSLKTVAGRGTTFSITLPLTLAITDAFLVNADGQRFAIPQTFVSEVFRVEEDGITSFENNEVTRYRNSVLPLLRLDRLFGLPDRGRKPRHVLVIGGDENSIGLCVDRILGQREIVVRGIADPLLQVPGVTGATELGDGHPVLILDPRVLTRARQTA